MVYLQEDSYWKIRSHPTSVRGLWLYDSDINSPEDYKCSTRQTRPQWQETRIGTYNSLVIIDLVPDIHTADRIVQMQLNYDQAPSHLDKLSFTFEDRPPPPDHTWNYDQRNSVPCSRNWVIEGITWKVVPRWTLPLEAAFAKALVGVRPDWQKERNLLKTRRPACPKTATSPNSPNQED